MQVYLTNEHTMIVTLTNVQILGLQLHQTRTFSIVPCEFSFHCDNLCCM